ncbi:MAG: phosphatidylserine/phosphatidylglycerophosphate/cardiolipin synthase family protein [Deltaproteobacteria bacterium]|nr:phosphatidylserine/phosphatidylglycerophosphate/cardiolipin synthase family protein [Deltaproteobacteria bacterium]
MKEMDALTNSSIRFDNKFELLFDYTDSMKKKIEVIKSARDIVLVSSFIMLGFGKDLVNDLVDALIQKASEGVSVYFIIDDFQSLMAFNYLPKLEKHGVYVGYYREAYIENKIPVSISDHEKYVLVDFSQGILGGQNIMHKLNPQFLVDKTLWRDVDVYIEGRTIIDMSLRFLELWQQVSPEDKSLKDKFLNKRIYQTGTYGHRFQRPRRYLDHAGEARFLYNGGGKEKNFISKYYLKAIEKAQEIIVWQGNFVDLPDNFVQALKQASTRGVRVILMTNSYSSAWWATHPYYLYKVLNGYLDFEESGAEIFEYQKRFNHSKTFYVDGVMASIGSCNHDYMSLEMDTEGTAIIYDKDVVGRVFEYLNEDMKNTKLFDASSYQSYKIYKRYLPFLPYPLREEQEGEAQNPDPNNLQVKMELKDSLKLTKDILLQGVKYNEDVYVVIGLENTLKDAGATTQRSFHHFKRMVVKAPDNIKNILKSQLQLIQDATAAVEDNYDDFLKWIEYQMTENGVPIELQNVGDYFSFTGRAFLGVAGTTYFLALKMPVNIAVALVKDVCNTSFSLVKYPFRGAVNLILAPAFLVYGAANTIIGTTPAALALIYVGIVEALDTITFGVLQQIIAGLDFSYRSPEWLRDNLGIR